MNKCPKCRTVNFDACHSLRCPMRIAKTENETPPLELEIELSKISEYVIGDNVAHRFKGLMIPVIEYNEAIEIIREYIERKNDSRSLQ